MALSINPIARYSQNQNWLDSWGTYDGTAIGATFDTVNQKLGNGAGFYTIDDYLQLNSLAAALATTTKGSWAGWVRPVDATASGLRIISFGDSTATKHLSVFLQTGGKLRAQAFDGVQQFNVITDNAVFSDNTYTHIGAVQDGVSLTLYADGSPVAQTPSGADLTFWFNDFANLDQGALGCLNDLTGPRVFFNGLLDEVLFFDDALVAADFTYLYNGGAGREIIKPTGFQAAWAKNSNQIIGVPQ